MAEHARQETVVLVHGLFYGGPVMLVMAARLHAAGYSIRFFSYPTRTRSLRDNARALKHFVDKIDSPVLHFVAHSLGGLVVRHYFAAFPPSRPGRVVTLGTPHRYSLAAQLLARFQFGRKLLRKSLEQGLLGDVPPWPGGHELGSIAGTLPVGLGRLVGRLPSPNDGTVTVEETRLDGMNDHICLPISHTALMLAPAAAEQTIHFLRHGRFQHR